MRKTQTKKGNNNLWWVLGIILAIGGLTFAFGKWVLISIGVAKKKKANPTQYESLTAKQVIEEMKANNSYSWKDAWTFFNS